MDRQKRLDDPLLRRSTFAEGKGRGTTVGDVNENALLLCRTVM